MPIARTPSRHAIRTTALVVALLCAGTGTAAANTGTERTTTVAHVLPGDRAIALIEGLDPANAGLDFMLMPSAGTRAIPRSHPEPINMCIPCDNLG